MEVIVPSFSGARSAEQPQSTILQFRQTQDGNVEHPADAWPRQVEEIHLQGILGCLCMPHESFCRGKCSSLLSRGVPAWELQECVTGGCCWLVGVQCSDSSLSQGLDCQTQMRGTDLSSCCSCLLAVLCTCLDRVFVLWGTVHLHGYYGTGFTDAGGSRFVSFVR